MFKRFFIYTLILSILCIPCYSQDFVSRPPQSHGIFEINGGGVVQIGSGTLSQTYTPTNRTRINSSGLLESVAANTPVIDYIGTSLTPTLRVEPVSINVLFNSRFATNGAGFTATATMANSGATGADGVAGSGLLVTDDSAVAAQEMYQGISKSAADSATYYRASVWVKKVTATTSYPALTMTFSGGTQKYATFVIDHVNGTLTAWDDNNAANIGSRIVAYGNGWQVDVWATDNGSNTAANWDFHPAFNSDGTDADDATATGTAIIDYGMISTGRVPGSLFIGADAIGDEEVTDGGFAAVTETAVYTSDFSAGTDSWTGANANTVLTGNTDGIGGEDDWLKVERIDSTGAMYITGKTGSVAASKTAKVTIKINNPVGSAIQYFTIGHSGGANSIGAVEVAAGSTVTLENKYVLGSTGTTLYVGPCNSSGAFINQNAGQIYYVKSAVTYSVSFTNWTCGINWYVGAENGSLTGKAQKVAGTASYLYQTIGDANKAYRVISTITRTAGSCYHYVRNVTSTAISASGGYTTYSHSSTATDYSGIYADASFAGTVDDFSMKEHGLARATEQKTISITTPASVLSALTGNGTAAIKIRFPYAKAQVSAATNILAFADSATSFLYMDSSGVFTVSDGTNTATNNDAFVADTDYILVVRWSADDNDMSVGLGAPGSVAFDAAGTFDDAFTTTGNTTYIGHTLAGGIYIHWIKIFNKELAAAQINALQ